MTPLYYIEGSTVILLILLTPFRLHVLQGNIKISWQNMQFADDDRIDWDEFISELTVIILSSCCHDLIVT